MKPLHDWDNWDITWAILYVLIVAVQIRNLFARSGLFTVGISIFVIAVWTGLMWLRLWYEPRRQAYWKAKREEMDRQFEEHMARLANNRKKGSK